MLGTLSEKVDPRHAALVLVDVQNDFCADGGAMHREGRDLTLVKRMIPRLERLLEAARAAKVKCVWIRCAYNTGLNHYLSEVWLEQARRRRNGAYVDYPVCEPGEWNGDFFQVRPRPDEVIVTKHRYGAFEGTDLDLVLRSRGIRTVIMTGVATNVCVESTLRHGYFLDYWPLLISDATMQAGPSSLQEATLFNVESFFGWTVQSEEFLAAVNALRS
jgi:ureidoacrylate peracid hydrolase